MTETKFNDWVIGTRVGLGFYPFCDGEIIEIQPRLVVGPIETDVKYKVKWDNPEYGVSDWLSRYDLHGLKNGQT